MGDKITEDIQLGPVNAGQTMAVLATSVCLTINSFAQNDDPDDLKHCQALFTLFVHQLASFSKDKKTIAKLLRVVADEMDQLATEGEAASGR